VSDCGTQREAQAVSQSASNPQWPICEQCGGVLWQVRREPLPTGFERQAFTCVRCGHVTERVVAGQPDDDTPA